MDLEFKEYISRFARGFETSYRDNGYGTGAIMIAIPQYQTIEAIQNISFSKDTLESLIQLKTGNLSGIYQRDDSPYIDYPITCVFNADDFNQAYTLTINPQDYLIWDKEIHRFIVLQESIFLTLYREVYYDS